MQFLGRVVVSHPSDGKLLTLVGDGAFGGGGQGWVDLGRLVMMMPT